MVYLKNNRRIDKVLRRFRKIGEEQRSLHSIYLKKGEFASKMNLSERDAEKLIVDLKNHVIDEFAFLENSDYGISIVFRRKAFEKVTHIGYKQYVSNDASVISKKANKISRCSMLCAIIAILITLSPHFKKLIEYFIK